MLSLDEYHPRVFEGISDVSLIDFLMGGKMYIQVQSLQWSGRYVRRLEYRINFCVNSALLILPLAVSIMIG